MKTGQPTQYLGMGFQGRQLGPAPNRLDAKFMVNNFDVSIEDMRKLLIIYNPYTLVINEKENRVMLDQVLQNELDKMTPKERTAVAMAYLSNDELTWLEIKPDYPSSGTKRKERTTEDDRTELDDGVEGQEKDLQDWTDQQLNKNRLLMAPILAQIQESI